MSRPSGSPLPEDALSAYADGECTDDERTAVEARLEHDPEWRAVLEEIHSARDLVRSLPTREPPAGFLDSLTAPRRDDRRVGIVPRVAAGLAAAAAIVVGFVMASPSAPDTQVSPPIASLADSHGATLSLNSDPVSGLATIAATTEIEP